MAFRIKLIKQNNTLASHDSRTKDAVAAIGETGEDAVFACIAGGFLDTAAERVNGSLVDGDYSFNQNDTYAMMEICGFGYAAFGGANHGLNYRLE